MTVQDPNQTWTFDTVHLGRTVLVFDQLDSTNTHALARGADPNQAGMVFLARSQSAGRGQYGRTWQAPPSSSVLMSVLLFPPAALRRPALLTAWAAVSVCETIQQLTDAQATIKWPNDVFVLGKKICGILIEQRTTTNPDFPLATVAGIGLNISQTAAMFEEGDLPFATSLLAATGQTWTLEGVAKALIVQLDAQYDCLINGDCTQLEALWKRRLGLVEKTVLVECAQQTFAGRLRDVTLAELAVEVGGETVRVQAESVRHLREM